MAIYIDELKEYPKRGKWCHMASDGDLEELHRFADGIGLKRSWFQNHRKVPHYDLTDGMRWRAYMAGAIIVSSNEFFEKCKVS